MSDISSLVSGVLELRHLRTLQQLRASGSLVEAAERLCVTQSALSHQLKELEGRLQATLFVRKSRPLRFTEVGKKLLQLAEKVLPQIADTERELRALQCGEAGRLFMAIECHSCFNWLMPTVEVFRQQWPSVEMDFSAGFTFEPLPALQRGEVDAVITSDPLELEGVAYQPLFVYEMQLACANQHPLASRGVWQPQDLASETVLTYPVERSRLDVFKRFLNPAGVEPKQIRTSELTLMMVQLAASNLGVCALPNWVLEEYRRQNLLSVASAGDDGVWPTLYVALREDSLQQIYVQEFLQLAREHCFKTLTGIRSPSVTGSIK
tara:strand:+ start:2820 stop:3785 length:966 start_codon:yes stop_codon:yes gene_type:complete